MVTGSAIGLVVIGRNEAARLRDALGSRPSTMPTVYVDSASSDGSQDVARQLGVPVVELSTDKPLSAARARNSGMQYLLQHHPHLRYVQFLDGDARLVDGWLEAAHRELESDANVAVVVGTLSEEFPHTSIYNRLCQMEWKQPTGEIEFFAGIALVRVEAFTRAGGYNPALIAGEEPELSIRMRSLGYRIRKLPQPMAIHDANLLRFNQWWKRTVRSGHAIGQRFELNGAGPTRDCAQERRTTLVWGVMWPLLMLAALALVGWPALILLLGYVWLGVRIWRFRQDQMQDSQVDALYYAMFCVLAKLPQAWGLGLFYFRRRFKKPIHIIE